VGDELVKRIPMNDSRTAAARRRLMLIAGIASLIMAAPERGVAAAPLQSQSSSFGPDTITFDPSTGLQWLDLTESIWYSHSQMLQETQPGGAFDGYHYATDAEIRQLFIDAGIDVDPGSENFIPANYAPIVALTNLIGVVGTDGSCGNGCSFSYTAGYTAEPPPFAGVVSSTDLAWFDNDPLLSPSYPQASIGRVLFGSGSSDSANPDIGSWLIVPEPDAVASGVVAMLAIASRRRSAR
jgi:hypothetical protein